MKIFLTKAIFVNRAPFDKLELDFSENEIAVVTAVNGKGKTTVISHMVDAFYEMARPHFLDFEGNRNDYYRISSTTFNLDQGQPSFAYLRFQIENGFVDYIHITKKCTEEQYNAAIGLQDKIPYNQIVNELDKSGGVKKISNSSKEIADKIFYNNLLTYFPSYRYEIPGYINDLYKITINFRKESKFTGYLGNPIEVIYGLPQLANWMMDIALDLQYADTETKVLKNNLDIIITQTLSAKGRGDLRYGVGPRGLGSTRIQIVNKKDDLIVCPSIFTLSSGEHAILCLFGELLRQADNYKNNILLREITGIVLVDEIDKHLHIKLQKEVLPLLFYIFPNVQFIVSSHSPFLSMGLAEVVQQRTKIIDIDNYGYSKDPTTNELYKEVYSMMITENERYKEMYSLLEQKVKEITKPLIITEGKTDWKHFKAALTKFKLQGKFTDLDIEFEEYEDLEMGDSNLENLLKNLSKISQPHKIIGIFDSDEKVGKSYDKERPVEFGNNVFGWCIPKPNFRNSMNGICVEFLYKNEDLFRKDFNGRRLFVELHNGVRPDCK